MAVEGETIIPVAKVMYRLGGGFGKAKRKDREGRTEEQPAGESGGGIRIVPMGIIEISHNRTRFLSFGSQKIRWIVSLALALLVGFAVGRYVSELASRALRRRSFHQKVRRSVLANGHETEPLVKASGGILFGDV